MNTTKIENSFFQSPNFSPEGANEAFLKSLIPFYLALERIGDNLSETFQAFLENPTEHGYAHLLLSHPQIAQDLSLKVEIFNLYRVLTSYGRGRAYGANPSGPSSDVNTYFNDDLVIPETGVIVLDFFAIRNLALTVERLRLLGEDCVDRLRVRIPDFVLYAHLKDLDRSSSLGQAFIEACQQIREDQVIIGRGLTHTSDIDLKEESVAARLAPRVDSINPDGGSFEQTEFAMVGRLQKAFGQLAIGGTAMLNMAAGKETLEPLEILPGELALNPMVRASSFTQVILEACHGFKDGKISVQLAPSSPFVSAETALPILTSNDELGDGYKFDACTYFVVRRDHV